MGKLENLELRRQRQLDQKFKVILSLQTMFKASLGYLRSCVDKIKRHNLAFLPT